MQMDPFHVGEEATQSSGGGQTERCPCCNQGSKTPTPEANGDQSSPRTRACSRACFSGELSGK